VEHGVSREDAYRMVQGHAMRAWKQDLDFRQLVLADKNITGRVPARQVEHAFDLRRQLRNIDKVFARVFKETGHRGDPNTSRSAKKKVFVSAAKGRARGKSPRSRSHRRTG